MKYQHHTAAIEMRVIDHQIVFEFVGQLHCQAAAQAIARIAACVAVDKGVVLVAIALFISASES